jgi:ribosomal protein L4
VVEETSLTMDKTKAFLELLDKLHIARNARLLLLTRFNEPLYRATRNLRQLAVLDPRNVGVADLLKAEHVLVAESALEDLEKRVAL